MSTAATSARLSLLQRGLRLEYLTIGWNLVEGALAVTAAVVAGSVALLGFGIDSFVESASGSVLVWRLRAEAAGDQDEEAIERIERRAERLVGGSFFALAAYIAFDAVTTLISQERPDASPLGIGVTAVSIGVMLWLARAKRRTAAELGSRALAADAEQTQACWYLSVVVLVGIGLNALFGWWWADPLAALGVTVILLREGREAWSGEDHNG
ncbi:MAG TPA: cation transporter [Candidatus Binatia bacterium]|nr:cation transporter [Candidatus Binatia bacterium]